MDRSGIFQNCPFPLSNITIVEHVRLPPLLHIVIHRRRFLKITHTLLTEAYYMCMICLHLA